MFIDSNIEENICTEFKEEFSGFSVYMKKAFEDLNERQLKAIEYVKENGSINNSQYQKLCDAHRQTATRDLKDLLYKNILKKVGKGPSQKYVIEE